MRPLAHGFRPAIAALAATVTLALTSGISMASAVTLYPGETVDVYTFNWSSSTTGYSVVFAPASGGPQTSVPITSVTQRPAPGGGYSDELQFQMPNLGGSAGTFYLGVSPAGGGALVARFAPVWPPITAAYGLEFDYSPELPVNDLPEVPYASVLPGMLAIAVLGGFALRRRNRGAQAPL